MTYSQIRRETFNVLDPRSQKTALERAGNAAISLLILLNVLAVILESMADLKAQYGGLFDGFETVSVSIFTLEYVLRVWTSVEIPGHHRPLLGRLRYVISPMALVDFAVILPGFVPGEYFLDLRFARVIRIVRMLRIFKVARYSQTLQSFARVFKAKRMDVALITLFLVVLVVVSSSMMYFAENPEQPDKFSSIPAAMWWSVMTLTTVGYGDIYPITAVGKFIGSIIALIGIGFFALPAGVLAAGFVDELAKKRAAQIHSCPHCGGVLE